MSLNSPQKSLTSQLDNFTFKWRGNEIDLRTSYTNMDRLEKGMGLPFAEAILTVRDLKRQAEVFYYLQEGTNYSLDDIQGAFFPNHWVLDDKDWNDQIERCAFYLIGADKLSILNDITGEEVAQKNLAD